MPHYNQYNGWGSGWFDCYEPQPPICTNRFVATQEVEEKEDDCRPEPEPCEDYNGGWGQGGWGESYGGGWGSGWFDCGCEPREPIICDIKDVVENEFNDGDCKPQPKPEPCDSGWGDGGWGNGGWGGHYGGWGGYTECGWAATKGWAWWNPQQNYCCEPRPDPCKDEYPESIFVSDTLQYPGSCFDPCYDPCEVRVQDDCNLA